MLSRKRLGRTPWLILGCALMLAATYWFWFDVDGVRKSIAWPWYAPIGGAVAFGFGYLLADQKPTESA